VAKEYARRGHEVFVFANHGSRFSGTSVTSDGVEYIHTATALNSLVNRIGKGLLALMRWLGAKTVVLPEFGASWRDAGYAFTAGRALRRLGCDVVHVVNYSQLAPIIRRGNPAIKICLHMGCEWLTQLDRRVVERRLDSIDFVVGCSEYITVSVAERFPKFADRCVTVHHGLTVVPPNDYSVTEPERVLFVGRVSPEKGVHVLVQAFQLVLQRRPKATLHITGGIGSAPYEYLVGLSNDPRVSQLEVFYRPVERGGKAPYEEWLKQAVGAELGKRVFFEGRVEHSSIGGCYKRATVLVNPSLSEAFGMSLIEAMMYGLPVIASRVGGMTEIVDHEVTGLLVEPADPVALAQAICEVLANRHLQRAMGAAGRDRALERYSWHKSTDALFALFDTAIDDLDRRPRPNSTFLPSTPMRSATSPETAQ
jgi:glycosyltransferase involved in cell wall biosynthesis